MKPLGIVCIVCVILIVFGLGISCVGFFMTAGDPLPKRQTVSETKTFSSDITEIRLETHDADIILMPGTDTDITVQTVAEEDRPFEITEVNGILTVTRPRQRRWFVFDFGVFYSTERVTVLLPEGYAGTVVPQTTSGDTEIKDLTLQHPLTVRSSSGDITVRNTTVNGDLTIRQTSGEMFISDCTVSGRLDAESSSGNNSVSNTSCTSLLAATTSGDCTVNGLTGADSITLSASSGSLRLTDSGANADIRLRATSGSIRLKNIADAQSITAHTSSGSIRLHDTVCSSVQLEVSSGDTELLRVTADSVQAEATSGDITCRDLLLNGPMSLRCSSGDILCRLQNPRSDFTLVTSTTSGSCNVRGDNGGTSGTPEIRARTTSGDILMYFG